MLLPAAAKFRRLLLLMLLINRLACPFVFAAEAASDVPSGLVLAFEQQLSSPRKLGHELFLCGARSSSSTVGRRLVLDMVVICFDLFILQIYCARSTGNQCWPDGCTCTFVWPMLQFEWTTAIPATWCSSSSVVATEMPELLSSRSCASSRAKEGRTRHFISFSFLSYVIASSTPDARSEAA